MDKRIETAWLLDFYGPLLTQRQQQLLRLYCEEDLSLAEIAEQEAISRQGVYDAVHKTQRQLEEYEKKLGLLARYRRMSEGLAQCRALLEKACGDAPGSEPLASALMLTDALLRDEEE